MQTTQYITIPVVTDMDSGTLLAIVLAAVEEMEERLLLTAIYLMDETVHIDEEGIQIKTVQKWCNGTEDYSYHSPLHIRRISRTTQHNTTTQGKTP